MSYMLSIQVTLRRESMSTRKNQLVTILLRVAACMDLCSFKALYRHQVADMIQVMNVDNNVG